MRVPLDHHPVCEHARIEVAAFVRSDLNRRFAGVSPFLPLTSLAVTGSREDFHLQVNADAGRTRKTPGSFLPGVNLKRSQTIGIRSYAEREC
jgi:hypothetical protein